DHLTVLLVLCIGADSGRMVGGPFRGEALPARFCRSLVVCDSRVRMGQWSDTLSRGPVRGWVRSGGAVSLLGGSDLPMAFADRAGTRQRVPRGGNAGRGDRRRTAHGSAAGCHQLADGVRALRDPRGALGRWILLVVS